ncbi:Zinc transporter zip3 [Biomphalaria glabrata]|nr:centromere protein H-like [Biomphalaria glabrata]
MDSVENKEMRSKEDSYEQSAQDWLEMKNKLENELQRLLVARTAVIQESSSQNFDELVSKVMDLKEAMLETSAKKSRNELVLKRLQLGKVLCDEIFNNDDSSNPYLQNSLKQLDLAVQILRIHKETKEYEEKLQAVKMTNVKLNKENLEMMTKLTNWNEKKQKLSFEAEGNEDYKRLKQQIEMKCQSIEVCRNIIKILIVGLGLDWSESPELTDLLLQCGEHVSSYM